MVEAKTAAELRAAAAEEDRSVEQKSDDRGYIVRGSD